MSKGGLCHVVGKAEVAREEGACGLWCEVCFLSKEQEGSRCVTWYTQGQASVDQHFSFQSPCKPMVPLYYSSELSSETTQSKLLTEMVSLEKDQQADPRGFLRGLWSPWWMCQGFNGNPQAGSEPEPAVHHPLFVSDLHQVTVNENNCHIEPPHLSPQMFPHWNNNGNNHNYSYLLAITLSQA